MTAIKPCDNRRVRSVAAERYPLALLSSHPESTEVAVDPHHIFPRSAIGGDSWFVEITEDAPEEIDAEGDFVTTTIIPHVVGLTREEHERVERHEAWIKLEDGEFVWYDRVAQTDPEDDLGEFQEWLRIGPLNPQPGQQGKPKRKRLKGDDRAKRKTISFRVPDDAERGSEVFDSLLRDCKEEMTVRGLKDDPDEITTYIALTGVMASWLQS